MAEKTFTEALNNLQNAAAEIGRQATTLEDSLKLFDAGMKEAEFCKEILDKADQLFFAYISRKDILLIFNSQVFTALDCSPFI